MLQLNYYSHLLLNSKHSFLIKLIICFTIYFICIQLNPVTSNYNVVECTIEHPANKQKLVPISTFAAPSNFRYKAVCNIDNIHTGEDLEHYLTLTKKELTEYRTPSLEAWYNNLTQDMYTGIYQPYKWSGGDPDSHKSFVIFVKELNFFINTEPNPDINFNNTPQFVLQRAQDTVRGILLNRSDSIHYEPPKPLTILIRIEGTPFFKETIVDRATFEAYNQEARQHLIDAGIPADFPTYDKTIKIKQIQD